MEKFDSGYRQRSDAAKAARARHLEKSPDDKEGAGIISDFPEFLATERRLKEARGLQKEEKLQLVRRLTQFNARWTEYVHSMAKDKKALESHWNGIRSLFGNSQEADSEYLKRRAGILVQVVMLKIFERLKLDHHLSTPGEDAYHKIDLWVQGAAVQLKASRSDKVQIFASNDVRSVHATIRTQGREIVASTGSTEEWEFLCKLREYGRETGQPNLTGFFMVIPNDQIKDKVTGEPTEELIDEVEKELGKFLRLPEKAAQPEARAAA